MRFHIVALPHTQVIHEFSGCAFTEKVRRFCIMMHNLGHEVFLYAGDEVEAPVTELITCVSKKQQEAALHGVAHYTQFPFMALATAVCLPSIGCLNPMPGCTQSMQGGKTQQLPMASSMMQ